MQAYKTFATIDPSGRVVLEHLPFSAGTLVEVLVVDSARAPSVREEQWGSLMKHVQNRPENAAISEADIVSEIAQVRETR